VKPRADSAASRPRSAKICAAPASMRRRRCRYERHHDTR
jgi:hypothetical protein